MTTTLKFEGHEPNMGLVQWRVILTTVLEIMTFDFEIFLLGPAKGHSVSMLYFCSGCENS